MRAREGTCLRMLKFKLVEAAELRRVPQGSPVERPMEVEGVGRQLSDAIRREINSCVNFKLHVYHSWRLGGRSSQ